MGAETGVGSFGELASGVYYVGGHVFGGELGGYGYLGDDMLHLWKRKIIQVRKKARALRA